MSEENNTIVDEVYECHMCGNEDLEDRKGDYVPVVFCEGLNCGRAFHKTCLNMSAKAFKKLSESNNRWRCPGCVVNGNSFERLPTPEPKQSVYYYIRVSSKGQDDPKRGRAGLMTQKHAIVNFATASKLSLHPVVRGGEVGSAWKHTDKLSLKEFISTMNPCAVSYNMRKADLITCLKAWGIQTSGTKDMLLTRARSFGLMDKIAPLPIVVYSVDRIARNMEYAKELVQLAHDAGTYFVSITEACTSKDPVFWTHVQSGEAYSRALSMHAKAVRLRKTGKGDIPVYTPFDKTATHVRDVGQGVVVDSYSRAFNVNTGAVIGIWDDGIVRPLTVFEARVCEQMGYSVGGMNMPSAE